MISDCCKSSTTLVYGIDSSTYFCNTCKKECFKKTEQCFCQSYYDDDNVLRDCTCGKC